MRYANISYRHSCCNWRDVETLQVLATPTSRDIGGKYGADNDPSNGPDGDLGLNLGQDDENMVSSTSGMSEASRVILNRDRHLRYRTRVFAAEYVMLMFFHLYSLDIHILCMWMNLSVTRLPVMFAYHIQYFLKYEKLVGVWVIFLELSERIQLILISLWQGNKPLMDGLLVIGLSAMYKK